MYYKHLLRHRQTWVGIAMLWIILFHILHLLNISSELIRFFISIGYAGVDICLFASGIGCFYSLSSDPDIGRFMKRRLYKLAPPYVAFILLWLCYKRFVNEFGFRMAIGNILALQHFTGLNGDFNWYISAIFLFYLLAPYFKIIIDRSGIIGKLFFLGLLFTCSIPFWRADIYIITMSRLPIFFIGMLFADICQKDTKVSVYHLFILAISFFTGFLALRFFFKHATAYLWSHALYWYPFILITPPLCIAVSFVFSLSEKIKIFKPIESFLSLCGNYSFEIYMGHIGIISLFTELISRYQLSKSFWLLGIVALVGGCIFLRCVTKLFNFLIDKKA